MRAQYLLISCVIHKEQQFRRQMLWVPSNKFQTTNTTWSAYCAAQTLWPCTLRVHLSHVQVHMQVSVNNNYTATTLFTKCMHAPIVCLSLFCLFHLYARPCFLCCRAGYFCLCPHLFPCSVLSSDVISKTSSAFLLTLPLLFSSILPTVALTTPASFHFSPVFPNMQQRKCFVH